MSDSYFRRWALAVWLPLAVSALVIGVLRFGAVLRDGPNNTTTAFEDISLWNINLIRYGEPAYIDCFQYPYRTSLFNWVFYKLYGGVAILVGPSDHNLATVLRLLTQAIVLLGFGASVYFFRSNVPKSATPAAAWTLVLCFAVLTWFGPIICWWALTVRPDLPAVVCEYLALVVIATAVPSRTSVRIVLAAMLFFMAWSLKQNQIGILLGAIVALLVQKDWRQAAWLTGIMVVLVGIVALTASPHYWTNVVEAPALAPWSFDNAFFKLSGFLSLGGVYLLWLFVLLYQLHPEDRQRLFGQRPLVIAACTLAVCLVVNLLGSGRKGAARNYYFESWVVGMMLTGLVCFFAAGLREPLRRSSVLLLPVASIAVLGFAALYTGRVFLPLEKPYTKTGEELEFSVCLPKEPYSDSLLEQVRTAARPIFCDDPLLVVQALGGPAAEVPVIEYTIYVDAVQAGRIRDRDMAARIRDREFTSLWLDADNSIWEALARDAGYLPQEPQGLLRRWLRPQREN